MGMTRREMVRGAGAAAVSALAPRAWAQDRSGPSITTARPDPYADAVLVDGEPPPPAADAFTFVVLPDTQNYSDKFPEVFAAQTAWIASRRDRQRIAAVFHLGDITNRNTPPEWENARRAMQTVDAAGVPVCLVAGNHDYSRGGTAVDRTTRLNDYFPVAGLRGPAAACGGYDREPGQRENTFQVIGAGGAKVPPARARIRAAGRRRPLGE